METVLAAIVTMLGTAIAAWLIHRREVEKQKTVAEVATTALHIELDSRMKTHVEFVETRLLKEREWYQHELERERDECAESINTLAGRLGIAEAELRELRRAKANGFKSGLPEA